MLQILLLSLFQSITVAHNDVNQTGSNSSESLLTTTAISTGKFGKICQASISGNTYAQPLYVQHLSVSGKGKRDTVIVTTMSNNVYAIDRRTCEVLWTTNLGPTWTTYSACCQSPKVFYTLPMGILGTGVIDPVALKLYVVSVTPTPSHVLNRIDLTTGNVEASITIAGSVPGTGGPSDNCASGGTLTFCTVDNMQGTALAISPDGTKVYIGFGGWENGTPGSHGWLFAYSTSGSLARVGIFCTTPNGYLSVPWMSRAAPSIDANGNVYVVTGNGDYDGITAFGECVLKFSPTLSLLGFFLNPNGSSDTGVDADFGSNRFLLIPGTTLGVAAGKDFSVYLIDTVGMTQVQTFKTNASGTPGDDSGSYGGAFIGSSLYLPTTTGLLYGFAFSSGTFNTTPIFSTSAARGDHNGQLSGSSNGLTNAIIWQVTCATSSFLSNPGGTLRAIDASNGTELWNSDSHGGLGLISKFAAPTVADGTVMVPTNSGKLVMFGVLFDSQIRGQATMRGQAVIR